MITMKGNKPTSLALTKRERISFRSALANKTIIRPIPNWCMVGVTSLVHPCPNNLVIFPTLNWCLVGVIQWSMVGILADLPMVHCRRPCQPFLSKQLGQCPFPNWCLVGVIQWSMVGVPANHPSKKLGQCTHA